MKKKGFPYLPKAQKAGSWIGPSQYSGSNPSIIKPNIAAAGVHTSSKDDKKEDNLFEDIIHNTKALKNTIVRKLGIKESDKPLSIKDVSIDITNKPMTYAKVNQTAKGRTIIGGEFIENNPNTVRKAKDWLNANDFYSDKNYPSKSVESFYGVENGIFKVGSASDFKPETEIVPRRFGAENIKKAVIVNNKEMRLVNEKNEPIYQNTTNIGKFILYSPSTKKSTFNFITEGKKGVDLVNKFIKENKDAQYIHLDNGRFMPYVNKPTGLTSEDFDEYYTQDIKREGTPGYNLILRKKGGMINRKNHWFLPKAQTGLDLDEIKNAIIKDNTPVKVVQESSNKNKETPKKTTPVKTPPKTDKTTSPVTIGKSLRVDLQKEYGLNPLSKEGIAKALEISKTNPNSIFYCDAKGCAQIASDAAQAMGNPVNRSHAWNIGNLNNVVYSFPKYTVNKSGKPLPDPSSFADPSILSNYVGGLVGLNRKNNVMPGPENDSFDYADVGHYPNSRGYEHIGYMLDKDYLLHGTGAGSDHKAFYTIDDIRDKKINLKGYNQYDPVEVIKSFTKSSGKEKGTSLLDDFLSLFYKNGGMVKKQIGGTNTPEFKEVYNYLKQNGKSDAEIYNIWQNAANNQLKKKNSSSIFYDNIPVIPGSDETLTNYGILNPAYIDYTEYPAYPDQYTTLYEDNLTQSFIPYPERVNPFTDPMVYAPDNTGIEEVPLRFTNPFLPESTRRLPGYLSEFGRVSSIPTGMSTTVLERMPTRSVTQIGSPSSIVYDSKKAKSVSKAINKLAKEDARYRQNQREVDEVILPTEEATSWRAGIEAPRSGSGIYNAREAEDWVNANLGSEPPAAKVMVKAPNADWRTDSERLESDIFNPSSNQFVGYTSDTPASAPAETSENYEDWYTEEEASDPLQISEEQFKKIEAERNKTSAPQPTAKKPVVKSSSNTSTQRTAAKSLYGAKPPEKPIGFIDTGSPKLNELLNKDVAASSTTQKHPLHKHRPAQPEGYSNNWINNFANNFRADFEPRAKFTNTPSYNINYRKNGGYLPKAQIQGPFSPQGGTQASLMNKPETPFAFTIKQEQGEGKGAPEVDMTQAYAEYNKNNFVGPVIPDWAKNLGRSAPKKPSFANKMFQGAKKLATADNILLGTKALNNLLEQTPDYSQFQRNYKEPGQSMSRGDWTTNQGFLQPNRLGYFDKFSVGTGSMQFGGELDMTDDEIYEFLAAGGELEFID